MSYIIETVLRSSYFILRRLRNFLFKVEIFRFEENMGLHKLSEWFEYNIKNINEFYHLNFRRI